MDRLGGIGIYQCSEIVPDFHSLTRCIVTLCSQYTLCVLRVPPWLCWTLTVLFTRQPCPADRQRTQAAFSQSYPWCKYEGLDVIGQKIRHFFIRYNHPTHPQAHPTRKAPHLRASTIIGPGRRRGARRSPAPPAPPAATRAPSPWCASRAAAARGPRRTASASWLRAAGSCAAA